MANTKNYSKREDVLDHYLSKGQWYSGKQLIDFCNRVLDTPIKSRQTLQNDLTEISNKGKVVIETKKVGRVTYYRYKDRGFSIHNSDFNDDDYDHLTQALDILYRFKGMPQFDWVDELDARFNVNFRGRQDERSIVGFESSIFNRGMGFFTPLFTAIKEKTTVALTYQSFNMPEPKVKIVSPYYLKQYNNRWYMIGKESGWQNISNYAFDRIYKVENGGAEYEDTDIDFDEYFDDIIGVSLKHDEEPVKIEIWFNTEQLKYVETKPIHGSQKVIHRDDTGGIVQLEVIPNFELEQKVLSFGERAKVLSPPDFQELIKRRIKQSLDNY